VNARYDPALRVIALRFAGPLDPARTLRIELLDGIRALDGAPLKPWVLTFTVGDR
jgi:hypothetical protein